MERLRALYVIIMLFLLFPFCGAAQEPPTDELVPLVLVRIIPIPGVMGRFDHMAVDNNGGRVFAAVYGNDSVEVLDTNVKSFAYYPYAVAVGIDDFRNGEISMRFKPLA